MQQDETEESENTWLTPTEAPVQSIQPLRNNEAADAFFDFDLEPESPGSPIDECEYTRLIESATHTPHEPTNSSEIPDDEEKGGVDEPDSHQQEQEQTQHETESGYVCASPCSSTQGSSNDNSSHNSSEIQYYDPESSESTCTSFYDCSENKKVPKLHNTSLDSSPTVATAVEAVSELAGGSLGLHMPYIPNGHIHVILLDSDSCSESLPPSQSTDSNHTYTALSSTSASNSTLQDENVPEIQTEEKVETDLNDNNISFNKNSASSPVKDAVVVVNGEYDPTDISGTDMMDKEITVTIDHAPPKSDDDEEVLPRKRETNRLASITETDEEEDFVDDKPARLRRCSSLKTGKTPPGTPGRKKFVRFADVLGLDLADVKTFLDHEVPKIPKSAYEDLEVREHQIQEIPQFMKPVDKVLVPLFQQPGGLPSFLDKVREKQVSLENCAVTDPISLTITGSVRVRNLDFHKSVYIRYTLDSWKSYSDIQANYVDNSCDGFSDKFTFTLFGNSLQIGQRIEIAVRFHCKGQQYWDSNYDSNYCFQCLPGT